jgi:hypothetical protein
MKDMRDGINKAIRNKEVQIAIEKGQEPLTERDRQMIEYGYSQCALDIMYDIATGSESFIVSLNK